MSERPTPEEIIRKWGMEAAEVLDQFEDPAEVSARLCIDDLAAHGYRIVHPDDVPERDLDARADTYETPGDLDYDLGWNSCLARIFGVAP